MRKAGTGVVIITGGSSGIGRCTAVLFARRGWRVGIIARGAAALAASRDEVAALGASVATGQADVTDSAALSDAANAIILALGPVDVWINCAGNGVYGRFADVAEAEFQRVTDVTYHGTVNGTRVALSHMRPRGQGSIVNVCSAIAFRGLPLMSSYAGAKAAVRAFSQAVGGELRLEGCSVRVSTVFPPAVNTPFFSHAPSYMGWPARPAKPVYQPEVVAQGIWQAMLRGRSESNISGTVTMFSLATRITPGVIDWCMRRLGIDGQMTQDEAACQLQESTLFAPSRRVFGIRGAFGKGAREWSLQLWLQMRWIALAKALGFKRRRRWSRPGAALLSTHVPPDPDQAPDGLASRPADS